MSIRVGILGYGNLGRGVECAIRQNPDMELKAVFTRRAPETVKILTEGVPVYHVDEAEAKKDEIDVLILCGGSATDLPVQTPKYAQWFNVVDSFDTHAKIPEHFAAVDESAQKSGKVGIISVGWDPGMFSLNRLYAAACLPEGENYTFWGKGVSRDIPMRSAGSRASRMPDSTQSQLRVHWRQSEAAAARADHPRKTHQRVLCCGRRGRGSGKDRE